MCCVEVQNNFGSEATLVKEGEPVIIAQFGKPTMLMLPYGIGSDALHYYSARRLAQFMDMLPPAAHDAPQMPEDELTKLIHELRT